MQNEKQNLFKTPSHVFMSIRKMFWEFSQQSIYKDWIKKEPLFHTNKQTTFIAWFHLPEAP